jgi:hypothetical protein
MTWELCNVAIVERALMDVIEMIPRQSFYMSLQTCMNEKLRRSSQGRPNLPTLRGAPSPQGFCFAEPSAARPEVGAHVLAHIQ